MLMRVSVSATTVRSREAGYSLGDAATNFFFQAMIMYQGAFYTDVMGLSSSAAAVLFLVVRGWDAFFDPS